INIRPVVTAIREFFGSSPLSQFMDQNNPLAELTHKRRLSALGPGGLSRDRAGFEVRDVHYTHYGRMCPIETPEGPNIGLISYLATFARINKYGFIEAPFRKIDKETGRVLDEVVYMTADVEDNYRVAQANEPLDKDGHFLNNRITIRYRDEFAEVDPSVPDFMDVSPKMLVSVATAMIPFLENDDANRALMGSNMQRQAVPLMVTDSPIVGTGMEYKAAVDSGSVVLAKNAGTVKHVDADHIEIETEDGLDRYDLIKFMGSNQGTCINQRPIVDLGQEVTKGQVIADGPATSNGEISLGKNALIGFMTWEGYNYEDAVLLNEKLIRDDIYTSIHIEEFELESRDTKLGPEEITRDIPNVGEDALANLDEEGIIHIGAEVKSGDILVGKVTPKGETERTAEERLLQAIFGEKAREVRDTSLRVPHGEYGIVLNVEVFTRANSDELSPGVNKVVRVYIAQKRKIQVGDKMAGRHGNKGVVSRVLPQEDMPFLPDGTPLDIVLNPLGVPSRMNIGQVLEVNIGMAARSKGWKIMTPVFDGAHEEDIQYFLVESKLLAQGNDQTKQLILDYEDQNEEKGFLLSDLMDLLRSKTEDEAELALIEEAYKGRDGKTELMDGRTGLPLGDRVTVGVMYYLKLHHLVDDKIHARSTGPYSLVTQQPLGGKAQFGGQRFGEMEVWALEAYGAAYTLQEILTVKSDDIVGRVKTYEAIVKGQSVPKSGVPESFKVLIKELQALGLDVRVLDKDDNEIDLRQNFDGDDIGFRLAENDDMKSVNDAEGASGYMTLDEQGEPMETEDEFDEFTADEEPTAEDLDSLSFDE
ncbi:MAG: DNA-directed RNA polymerase subunit beta, partial [Clostridia bacterium]|nr:DNA-directed RNA polymerase subunit beta [Clostridia bacterium]